MGRLYDMTMYRKYSVWNDIECKVKDIKKVNASRAFVITFISYEKEQNTETRDAGKQEPRVTARYTMTALEHFSLPVGPVVNTGEGHTQHLTK